MQRTMWILILAALGLSLMKAPQAFKFAWVQEFLPHNPLFGARKSDPDSEVPEGCAESGTSSNSTHSEEPSSALNFSVATGSEIEL